jgi:integrase/recombinase XerD
MDSVSSRKSSPDTPLARSRSRQEGHRHGPHTYGGAPSLQAVVTAYLDHLAVERGLAVNTIAAYRRDLARYAAHLETNGVAFTDVDERTITAYLRSLREGDSPLSAASAAAAVSAVRGLHRFAAREGHADDDPSRDVHPPTLPRRLPKALGVDEVRRLLEAAAVGMICWHCATSRCSSSCMARGRGSRRRSGWPSTTSTWRSAACCYAARADALGWSPWAGTRGMRCGATWYGRGRPWWRAARTGRTGICLFRNARGGPLTRQGAWLILRQAADRAGLRGGSVAARAAPLVRHPPARRRRRRAGGPGTARPRVGDHDPDLHAGHGWRLREVYAVSHPRAR